MIVAAHMIRYQGPQSLVEPLPEMDSNSDPGLLDMLNDPTVQVETVEQALGWGQYNAIVSAMGLYFLAATA